jgi:hypothetical protein
MNYLLFTTFTLLTLTGCASFGPTIPPKAKREALEFKKIENVRIEEMNSLKVLSLFGKPDEVFETRSGKELWAYNEDLEGKPFPRLNLLIDPEASILTSMTWIPREEDEVYTRDQMLSHFKGAKFSTRMEGMIAYHYFSDDLIDEDLQKGLSIYTHGLRKSVMSVSWFRPKHSSLANQN